MSNDIAAINQQAAPLPDRAVLYKKMAQVTGELQRVKKNGRNEFHKYDYATASDIKDAVRAALAKYNLALFPDVTRISKTGAITQVDLSITVACGDTGESITIVWYGEAQDSGDKGFNKAMTSAMKYFLIDTFLISTGDEADTDASPAPQGQQATKQNKKQGKPHMPPTQEPQSYAAPKPEPTPDERAAEETYHQNKRDAARKAEQGKPQAASPFQRQKLIEEYQRAYGIDKQIAQLETAHIDTYALAKNVLEEVENYSIAPESPMTLEQYRFITGWYTQNYVNEEVTGSLHHVLHNVADQAGFQWPAIPQDYATEWVDFLKAETVNYNAEQAAAAHVGPN